MFLLPRLLTNGPCHHSPTCIAVTITLHPAYYYVIFLLTLLQTCSSRYLVSYCMFLSKQTVTLLPTPYSSSCFVADLMFLLPCSWSFSSCYLATGLLLQLPYLAPDLLPVLPCYLYTVPVILFMTCYWIVFSWSWRADPCNFLPVVPCYLPYVSVTCSWPVIGTLLLNCCSCYCILGQKCYVSFSPGLVPPPPKSDGSICN